MNPFSIASLFACVAYSFLLGYHLPRSRTMRAERPLCFVLACFTLYSGAYIFLFGSPNIDSAFFWYKVSSLGWCLFPGALFLFVYSLVKGKLPLWVTAAALLPGAALRAFALIAVPSPDRSPRFTHPAFRPFRLQPRHGPRASL